MITKMKNYDFVCVFDIDGTIMNDVFKSQENWLPVEQARNLLRTPKISTNFIKFFYNIKNCEYYFVTGRTKKSFGDITYEQLSVLNVDLTNKIIFMPDDMPTTYDNYYLFKITTTTSLFQQSSKTYHIVFDDRDSYYSSLKQTLEQHNIKNNIFMTVTDWDKWWKHFNIITLIL